ncbi:MAG: DUF1127 domain-containing protein [Alphaproteobacteria bacterium]|nr:DUF1127 domain-containing protein [Alphaproteobacteria bacterium]
MSQYESNLSIGVPSIPGSEGLRRFGGGLSGRAVTLLSRLLEWRERARSRQQLAGLDDYMLRDIGIDRAAAAAESDKAFWSR